MRGFSPLSQRRDGIADEPELVGAGHRKFKPVGEALHAGGLARGEGAVLRGMDEHQSIPAQMGHDGRAQPVPGLACIAVLEVVLRVRPLKIHSPAHGRGRAFPLAQAGEIAQVALAVGPGHVGREPGRAMDFQDLYEVAGAVPPEMFLPAVRVIVGVFHPRSGCQWRKITNGFPQGDRWLQSDGGTFGTAGGRTAVAAGACARRIPVRGRGPGLEGKLG